MDNFGDLWVFRGSASMLRWERLVAVGLPPCPRYGHQVVMLSEDEDDTNGGNIKQWLCSKKDQNNKIYISATKSCVDSQDGMSFVCLCQKFVPVDGVVSNLFGCVKNIFSLHSSWYIFTGTSLGGQGQQMMVLGGCSVSPQGEMVGSNLAPGNMILIIVLIY